MLPGLPSQIGLKKPPCRLYEYVEYKGNDIQLTGRMVHMRTKI
jgi:hypothetical protein